MANQIVGYYDNSNVNDLFNVMRYCFQSSSSYRTYAYGDEITAITNCNATKYALVALPGDSAQSSYSLVLVTNASSDNEFSVTYHPFHRWTNTVGTPWEDWSEVSLQPATVNSHYSDYYNDPYYTYNYAYYYQFTSMQTENKLPYILGPDGNVNLNQINIFDGPYDNTNMRLFIQEVMGTPHVQPGRGSVTLTLKKPGQNLIFNSNSLGNIITQFIEEGNNEVNII